MKKRLLLFAAFPIICLLTLSLFKSSLNNYFFQDDWFVLNMIKNVNYTSILGILIPRNDIIYYRPLGMQLFFFLSNSFFGLNPLGFHLISFEFHLINIFLIGLISYQILRSKLASAITSYFYATAAFHYMTISWLSLTWNSIGTSFNFASIYFFILYINKSKLKYLLLAYIAFIFGIITTEFAIIVPAVSILLGFMSQRHINKNFIKKSIYFLTPSAITIIIYALLRVVIFPVNATGDYKISINLQVLKNIVWYGLWLIGIPQELKFQIVFSQLKITEQMLTAAGKLLLPFFISWLVFIGLIVYTTTRNLNKKTIILILIMSAAFLIGLIPILFIPSHTYPYYLSISSVGIFVVLGYSLSNVIKLHRKKMGTILIAVILISWGISMYINLDITKKTSWIPAESNLSKLVSEKALKTIQKSAGKSYLLIISKNNVQVEQSLMDQNAMQVLLNDQNTKTFFKSSDLIENYKSEQLNPNSRINVIFYE